VIENETTMDSMDPGASLERALAGDYKFSAGDVLREAWVRVAGNKGKIWLALLAYILTALVVSLLFSPFTSTGVESAEGMTPGTGLGDLLENLVGTLVLAPIGVGILFVGVAIASDSAVKPASVFAWYDRILPLFLTTLLMSILIGLGTLLLVLPGIYLAISYQLALPLCAGRKMSPWEAMETSRKIITHRWFTFFGIWLMLMLAIIVSSVLFGVPLIWVLPMAIIAIGILYRETVGAEAESLARVAGGEGGTSA
jgi:hypothetical protein